MRHKHFYVSAALLLAAALMITLCACVRIPVSSADGAERSEEQPQVPDSAEASVSGGAAQTPETTEPSEPAAVTPEPEDVRNGTYHGFLDAGVWETLIISDFGDTGFSFQFSESGISGAAEFSDDGYAYYYDSSGQGINFKFENSAVLVDAGYRYGSLAAAYTRDGSAALTACQDVPQDDDEFYSTGS